MKTAPNDIVAHRLRARAQRLPAPYLPSPVPAGIDLFLDMNEGPRCPVDLAKLASECSPEILRRYPDSRGLEAMIASKLGVDPRMVIATAGGDEAIDRVFRSIVEPGDEVIFTAPSFEMISKYAAIAGAKLVRPQWLSGAFPLAEVKAAASPRTRILAVVSPNNPTGAVLTRADLATLAFELPNVIMMIDLAYTEFADEDLTPYALSLPHAVIIRTFSKAYSMAGMRVGYAVGPTEIIDLMRSAAGPFPVSSLSLLMAMRALESSTLESLVSRVRHERAELERLLNSCGARSLPSQANFVLAHFRDAVASKRALADRGIAVRSFAPGAGLETALRITCTGDEMLFERLCEAIKAAAASGDLR